MADEKTFTQADIDAAVAKANEKHDEDVAGLKTKVETLISDNKRLKRGAEISPEDLQAAEDRADKAEAKAADLGKQVTALTKERDTAAKALETEQGAARSYALDAEINAAIAGGNVVPALVPAFTAMVRQNAKADLVDGKYSVTIGDKPASEHIKAFLESEDGKHFRAAPANGGGGAPGGAGGAPGGKNPFAKDTFNMTEQAGLIKTDPVKAQALAKEAGVELTL